MDRNMKKKGNPQYTKHAERRCNQRGVPQKVANFIINYGDCSYTHRLIKHYINRDTLQFLRKEYPDFVSKYDKQLETTAVVCAHTTNKVVTVMKNTKKFKRQYGY